MSLSKPLIQIAAQYAPLPSHEEIAALAQKFWEQGGQNSENNWLLAEAQLKAELISKFANALQKSISPAIQELTGQLVELSEEHDDFLASALASHLREEDVRQEEIMTENLKFFRNYGEYQILILEDTPKLRTLYMDLRFNTPAIGAYTSGAGRYNRVAECSVPIALALPYVVYVIRTNRVNGAYVASAISVSFCNKPLKSLKQVMHAPLLPNIAQNGRVCIYHDQKQCATSIEAAQNIILSFWQSQFNYMLFKPHNFKEFSTFEAWSEKSKENPLFALSVNWPTPTYELHQIVYNYNPEQGRIAKLKKFIADNKQTYIKEIRKTLEQMSDLHPIKPVV